MKISFKNNGDNYYSDLNNGTSLAIPLQPWGPRCFYSPRLGLSPVQSGSFIGEVKKGGPVNFFNVELNPHGNGTHTECLGHIYQEHQSLPDHLNSHHFLAQLITVNPVLAENNDKIIGPEEIPDQLLTHEALIVRTLPNGLKKLNKDYSGTNPCYFSPQAMQKIVDAGIHHLLCDLPSVDREEDEGRLESHNIFWSDQRYGCTITELIYVPEEVNDGLYLLNLQVTSLMLDASPSNPVIYPVIQANEESL